MPIDRRHSRFEHVLGCRPCNLKLFEVRRRKSRAADGADIIETHPLSAYYNTKRCPQKHPLEVIT